jgi:hypothetical protein
MPAIMDQQFFFERNLLALDREGENLCERLSVAVTTAARYRMLEARNGGIIPSIVDLNGKAHPLHSLIDPVKEAERLVSSTSGAGFLLFLGLGGGYQVESALKNEKVERIIIIDFDIDGIAEILSHKDFVHVFNDKRVSLLVDPDVWEVEKKILESYRPLLHGNLRSIPLRTRCNGEKEKFFPVADAVNRAIEKISLDYSVQAQFGKRWFSNIVHNILRSGQQSGSIPPAAHVAVCAAGPSLDKQIGRLRKRRSGLFVIATDTSFLTLVNHGIVPDAVLTIDCQHIAYRHFIGTEHVKTRLFLDIAAPPHPASLSPYFFSDSHPFSLFVSKYYKSFPQVDVSGGNVTYAAVSLAAALQAETIELYGADFSYPEGKTYTQGAYIYPYFDFRQNRFQPMETLFSSFVFRSNNLMKKTGDAGWFYQTPSLLMYKNSLEEYSRTINASVTHVAAMHTDAMYAEDGGGPISVVPQKKPARPANRELRIFSTGPCKMAADAFLRFYCDTINSLPALQGGIEAYFSSLTALQAEAFFTLIPLGSSLKAGKEPGDFADVADIIEETKRYNIAYIQKVLAAHER